MASRVFVSQPAKHTKGQLEILYYWRRRRRLMQMVEYSDNAEHDLVESSSKIISKHFIFLTTLKQRYISKIVECFQTRFIQKIFPKLTPFSLASICIIICNLSKLKLHATNLMYRKYNENNLST